MGQAPESRCLDWNGEGWLLPQGSARREPVDSQSTHAIPDHPKGGDDVGQDSSAGRATVRWMTAEDESSDPATPVGTTDAELFDSALDVGAGDDGALENPNSDT